MPSSLAELSRVGRLMADLKRARLERIGEAIASASIPLPDDLRSAIAQQPAWDALAILTVHPGYPLAQLYRSYQLNFCCF